MTTTGSPCNGWKNRQTWNCALWVCGDEGLYRAAVDFMRHYTGRSPYADFIVSGVVNSPCTADGVFWMSSSLSLRELNTMMRELIA